MAAMTTVPVPMVSALPEIDPGPERMLNVTALPEAPPVADSAIGDVPKVIGDAGGVKLIIWEACVILVL